MSVNSIYQPLNTGSHAEAAAGNAALIVNGADRDVNSTKIRLSFQGQKTDLKALDNCLQKLTDTNPVKAVKKYDPQKEEESRSKQQPDNPGQQPKKRSPARQRQERPYAWKVKMVPTKQTIITAAEIDKFQPNKAVDLELLQRYSWLYAQSLLATQPAEETQAELAKITAELDLPAELLNRFQAAINTLVFEEFAQFIKTQLLASLNSPQKMADFILKSKLASTIFNFAFFNEFLTTAADESKANYIERTLQKSLNGSTSLDAHNIKDLLRISEQLGIDPKTWAKMLRLDKLQIEQGGAVSIDTSILKTERIKALLLDEYRLLEVERLLSNKIMKGLVINLRKNRVYRALHLLGTSQAEIDDTLTIARRIAWAKTIATLKELHVKRVLTSSLKDFSLMSLTIKKQTLLARKLGFDISNEGVQWIESRLEQLALDSAVYKLELLKSMQSLGYEKQREEDIKQLSYIITQYQNKVRTAAPAYAS